MFRPDFNFKIIFGMTSSDLPPKTCPIYSYRTIMQPRRKKGKDGEEGKPHRTKFSMTAGSRRNNMKRRKPDEFR